MFIAAILKVERTQVSTQRENRFKRSIFALRSTHSNEKESTIDRHNTITLKKTKMNLKKILLEVRTVVTSAGSGTGRKGTLKNFWK